MLERFPLDPSASAEVPATPLKDEDQLYFHKADNITTFSRGQALAQAASLAESSQRLKAKVEEAPRTLDQEIAWYGDQIEAVRRNFELAG